MSDTIGIKITTITEDESAWPRIFSYFIIRITEQEKGATFFCKRLTDKCFSFLMFPGLHEEFTDYIGDLAIK